MTEQQRDELRREIATLKIHLVEMETWLNQANNFLYNIEEKLFDHEDNSYRRIAL